MSATNGKRAPVRVIEEPHPDNVLQAVIRRESASPDFTLVNPLERYLNGDELFYPMGWGGRVKGYPRERTERDGKFPANALSEDTWRRLIPFIRDLCDSNALAGGFHGHLLNFILGKGSTWKVVLRGSKTGAVSTGVADANADGKADTDPSVQNCQKILDEWRHFAAWGEASFPADDFDLDGEDSVPRSDQQYEAFRRASRDGEIITQFTEGSAKTDYLPHARHIDPERIRTPPEKYPEGYEDRTDLTWEWGIGRKEEDIAGTLIGFYKTEPDNPNRGIVVPAGRVAYLPLNVDSCIYRGLSDFYSVRYELEKINRLLGAMAEVAAILSKYPYLVQHATTTTATQVAAMIGTQEDWNRRRPTPSNPGGSVSEVWTEAGVVPHLSAGQEFKPAPVQEGASGFIEVVQACLRAVGQRFGIPEYFSGDASNSNMASTYMAGGPFERYVTRRQKDFEQYELAVAGRVLRFAVKAKRLSQEDVAKCKVLVTFPSPAIRGEMEQAQVATAKMQVGFSQQTLIQELGGDPEVEAANKKAWQAQFPPTMPGQPPGQGPPGGGGGKPPDGNPGQPSGDSLGDLLGGVSESRPVREGATPPGPPPHPGLVWKPETSRWVHQDTGADYEPKQGDKNPPGDEFAGAKVEPLTGTGAVSDSAGAGLAKVTTADGKEYFLKGGREGELKKEAIVSDLAQLSGVPSPKARVVSAAGKTGLLTDWVSGKRADQDKAGFAKAIEADPKAATKMGLHNFLVAAQDKSTSNYMVDGGKVVTIDHGEALGRFDSRDSLSGLDQDAVLAHMEKAGIPLHPEAVQEMAASVGKLADHLRSQGLEAEAKGVEERGKVLAKLAADPEPTEAKLRGLLGAKQESVDGSPPGPPPRPDLTWNPESHRWRNLQGKEHAHVPTTEKARTALQVAATKVQTLAIRAAGLMSRLGIEPEDLFDTPDDAGQIGNNPLWGGVATKIADPMADHLGVSTHTALSLASHALAYAFVKAKKALQREAVEGLDELVATLCEMASGIAAELGAPDHQPDVEAVKAWLQEKAKPVEG